LNRLLIILVFCSLFSFSQEKEVEDITSYPNSVITLNINYNSWTNPPPTMEISPLSVGFDIYGLYTFMGKNKFVSLAAGGGFGIQNVKSNSSLINADSSYFQTLPKELNYRKNKITTVFIDVPIELRFRVRPNSRDKAGIVRKRNFRVALGFKVAALLTIEIGGHILPEISKDRTQTFAVELCKNDQFLWIAVDREPMIIHAVIMGENDQDLNQRVETIRKSPDVVKVSVIPMSSVVKGWEISGTPQERDD